MASGAVQRMGIFPPCEGRRKVTAAPQPEPGAEPWGPVSPWGPAKQSRAGGTARGPWGGLTRETCTQSCREDGMKERCECLACSRHSVNISQGVKARARDAAQRPWPSTPLPPLLPSLSLFLGGGVSQILPLSEVLFGGSEDEMQREVLTEAGVGARAPATQPPAFEAAPKVPQGSPKLRKTHCGNADM